MNRFVFRLAQVLRLREFEFEEARKIWQLLDHERQAREARVGETLGNVANAQAKMAREIEAGCIGRSISLRARGLAVGRFQQAQAEGQLAEIEGPCETARERMLAARVPVRSLERLRERQEAEHRAAAQREDQAVLDEMAVLRAGHARATSEGGAL